jgi:SnoaL-like domain
LEAKEKTMSDQNSLSLDALYSTSVKATSLTGEAADRIAIRELINAWGHCADRRLAQQQSDLFIPEGIVEVYQGDPTTTQPVTVHHGKSEIFESLGSLHQYDATTHFNGQSTIAIKGDHAISETYCLAHHLWMSIAAKNSPKVPLQKSPVVRNCTLECSSASLKFLRTSVL